MKASFYRTSAFRVAALWSAGALICLLRNPLVFLHPIAGWEDGTQGINIYGHAGAPLFHMYSGYVQAWPNLIFRLVMFTIPLPYVPYAFGLSALIISAAILPACYLFMRNALQMDGSAATIGAVVIGVIPLGDWIMMANVDDSIWAVAAILILCAWNPLPGNPAGRIGYVTWRAISVATNPLALPVTFVWAAFLILARRQADRWVWGALVAAALAYAVFGIEHRPDALQAPGLVCAQALRLASQSTLLALIPGTVFLGNWPDLPLLAAVLAMALAMLAAVRKRPAEIAIFSLGLGAMCMICALGRGGQHAPSYLIYTNRYAYVQRLLWCCMMASALCDVWSRYTAAFIRLGMIAVCALLVVVQVVGKANVYAWGDVATSDRLLAFLAESSNKLNAGGRGPFTLVRIDQYGDWSIVVAGPGVNHL